MCGTLPEALTLLRDKYDVLAELEKMAEDFTRNAKAKYCLKA